MSSIALTARPGSWATPSPRIHPITQSQESHENKESDIVSQVPLHLTIFTRFMQFLQVSLISLFSFNEDFFWQITFTLLSAAFVLLTAIVRTPCLLNCYCDKDEIIAGGVTIDLLRLMIDWIEITRGITAAVILFNMGGSLLILISKIEVLLHGKSQAMKTILMLIIGALLVISNAAIEVIMTCTYNERTLIHRYQPDKVKKFEADEGAGVYVYKYQSIIDTSDRDYLILAIMVKFFSRIHAHIPELVYSCTTVIACDAVSGLKNVLPAVISDESRNALSVEIKSIAAYHKKIFSSLVFASILFNSLILMVSLLIVGDQSQVYLLPSSALIEFYKVVVSAAVIIIVLRQGYDMQKQVHRAIGLIHPEEENHQTESLIAPASKIVLVVILSVSTALALLCSQQVNDVEISIAYQSNWTYDWVKYTDMSTETEMREKVEQGLMMIPIEYPYPPNEVKKLKKIPFL